jgi:hypothetical protein
VTAENPAVPVIEGGFVRESGEAIVSTIQNGERGYQSCISKVDLSLKRNLVCHMETSFANC